LKAYEIKSVLTLHVQMVFNFFACLVKQKNKYKVPAGSLKGPTNSKDCTKSSIRFFSGFQSLSLIDFWTNFQDHRQLLKHFLGSQAAIGKQEQVS
jgi:hypothetical protein